MRSTIDIDFVSIAIDAALRSKQPDYLGGTHESVLSYLFSLCLIELVEKWKRFCLLFLFVLYLFFLLQNYNPKQICTSKFV